MGLDTGAFHSGRILTRRTVRSSPRRRSAVGHSHSCASSVPAYPAVARGPAYGVSERLGDMTAPLVFLGVDVLHWSEARRCVRRDNARALRQRCRLGFYPLNRSAEVFLRWLRCVTIRIGNRSLSIRRALPVVGCAGTMTGRLVGIGSS